MGVLPLLSLLAALPPYVVGVSVPLSGPRQSRGEILLRSVEMKADEINARGGIDGRRIELVVQDDLNTADGARAAAETLGADARVVAVIGHYDNEPAAAAVPVYGEHQLPVFLPSIGNKDVFANSPWAFSGTYDREAEAQIMVAFIKLLRHHDDVVLFSPAGIYDSYTRAAFLDRARSIGLKTRSITYPVDSNGDVPGDFVEKNMPVLPAGAQAIVIIGQSQSAGAIIHQLRERGIKEPIYGGSRTAQGDLFKAIGTYTDDLHAAYPFMYDMGSQDAVEFHAEYLRRYKSEPSSFGIFAYDGLGIIAEAIRTGGGSRQAIRDYLARMNTPTRAYPGASGPLYFDLDGSMVRDVVMASVTGGRFRPCFEQLKAVTDEHSRKTLPDRIKRGEVIMADHLPLYVVHVIYAGVEFYRVNQVNVKDLTFEAEFFLWLRWSGDVDVDGLTFLNEIPGRGYRVEMRKATVAADWHGGMDIHWVSYRYKGTFLHAYDLHQFPFDRQEMPLLLAHRAKNANGVQLVADLDDLLDMPVHEIYPQEWDYLGRLDSSATFRFASAFGNPTYKRGEPLAPYSVYKSAIQVRRILFPYLITLFLPLGILIFVSLLALLIPKEQFNPRNGLVMSALLGVLVYHMATARSLPQVGYLMKADIYFVLAYALVGTLVLGINAVNLMLSNKQEARAALWDRWLARIFVSGAVIAYSLLTFSALHAAR